MSLSEISKENLLYPLPELNLDKVWIAGGAVRSSLLGEKYSDIDVFGQTKEDLNAFVETLNGYKLVYNSENLRTYKKGNDKVQVIFREYKSIKECLNSFDYTICQFAMNNDGLYCMPDSLIHLFRKRLVVNQINLDYAADSLRRMQKYIKRGFTICDGGIAQIMEAVRGATDEQIENAFSFYPDGTARVIRFD